MRKVCLVVVVIYSFDVFSYAQKIDDVEKVMMLSGVDSPEELDPSEVERISDFLDHPLRINMLPESKLISSGILTRYQVASLVDYRIRHGNVMSYTELAAVDGFTPEKVSILRDFISLECHDIYDGTQCVQNDLAVKSACKFTEQNDYNYGLKYRLRTDAFSMSIAASKSNAADAWFPDAYSGALTYDFKRIRGRVVFGDFNARFGQGLALWSGAFITSLNSPDAFMKKSSGISEAWSFTGSSALTGFAGSFSFKRLTLTVLSAFPGVKSIGSKHKDLRIKPSVNLSWSCMHGSLSMTHVAELTGIRDGNFRIPVMRTASDAAFCIRGVNLFGEMAYDWVSTDVHALTGTDFRIGESGRMAALLKYLPSKWDDTAAHHGAAMSISCGFGRMITQNGSDGFGAARKRHTAAFSIDAIRYIESKDDAAPHSIQVKLFADWRYLINEYLEFKVRFSERLRTWGYKYRTDLRSDIIYMNGPFDFTLRMNILQCVNTSFATYIEQGYKYGWLSAYLRQGIFFVDDWEDRIYIYERDAPGSFNVPAMYGRGWFASFVLSAKITYAVRLYFRAAYTGYDFMSYEKRKPGKAELKLQLVLRYL